MTDRIDDALLIAGLAALSPIEYERRRKEAAEQLGIARLAVLDMLVEQARGGSGKDKKGQGRPLVFPEIEIWPDRVDGDGLLAELVTNLGRFIVMTEASKTAAALWVIHTYLFDRTLITPRLIIKSSQKRCGKTSALMVLSVWVRRPLDTAGITPAALYRTIEMSRPAPTLLVDEADNFIGDNHRDDLRAMLNAGFSHNGQVLRVVGEDHEPRQFSCHCPVVLALIGRLWDTLEDRAIQIRLQRRRRDENIEELSAARLPELQPIAQRIARWVQDNGDAIIARTPQLPGGLNDRAADCWRLLCAIADQAGGDWPQQARAAAAALSEDNDDTETMATRLLRDIRELFDATPSGVLFSAEIIASLLVREDHGWAEMGRAGKPLSTIRLARLLHPFRIIPNTVRRGFDCAKGYQRQQFEDAWERYL